MKKVKKNWSKENITINKEIFSSVATGYKRQLIYNSYSKLVVTKPYKYVDCHILNELVEFILSINAPDLKTNY
jgi:hypothetical protein